MKATLLFIGSVFLLTISGSAHAQQVFTCDSPQPCTWSLPENYMESEGLLEGSWICDESSQNLSTDETISVEISSGRITLTSTELGSRDFWFSVTTTVEGKNKFMYEAHNAEGVMYFFIVDHDDQQFTMMNLPVQEGSAKTIYKIK